MKTYSIKKLCFVAAFAVMSTVFSPASEASNTKPDEAEFLYKKFGEAVYQVEVVDVASGKKTSIGSGFQISKDGLLATNYHVVAEKLNRPDNNRMEFADDKGNRGKLKILLVDVVNDLSILQMEKPGANFFSIDNEQMAKGTKMFSIGNPHDIGFTIIEGTYNGIAKDGVIDKIHFSGSLNPGMSGGPAISHDGTVVGINVATAGNQISFLVPVQHLLELVQKYQSKPDSYDFMKTANKEVEAQLLAEQDRNIKNLLSKKWAVGNFGPMNVPGKISDEMKCWGGINHKDEDDFQFFYSICSNQGNIFLDQDFTTGAVVYRYNYLLAKPKLFSTQFYNLYERQYAFPEDDNLKNAKEGDVTEYECNDDVIKIADSKWKASFCVRQYKKYPKLYDLNFYTASLSDKRQGFNTTLLAEGISKENAVKLAKRFVEEFKKSTEQGGKKK